jgi:hypothetical protein
MWIKAKIEKENDDYYLRRYCISNSDLVRVVVHTKTRKFLEPGIIILSVSPKSGRVRPIRRTANRRVTKAFFTGIMIEYQEMQGDTVLIYKTGRYFDSKLELIWGCSKIKNSKTPKDLEAYYHKLYKTIFKDGQEEDNV